MAGKPVARIGDPGSHGGAISTGSNTIFVNDKPMARVGDTYNCSKHGPNPIVTGVQWIFGENQLVAHVGSKTACGATITSGSPDTFVDVVVQSGTPFEFAEASKKYDEQVRVKDEEDNFMVNVPYYISCSDGTEFYGLTDEHGCCGERVYTKTQQELTIYVGLQALERWPQNG